MELAGAVPRPWRYGLLLGAYLLFLLLGAGVLVALEGAPEEALRRELRAARARLLQEHRACLTAPQLERLLERLVAAGNYGVSGLGNVSGDENWEFTSALFFTASVLTTTGKRPASSPSKGGPPTTLSRSPMRDPPASPPSSPAPAEPPPPCAAWPG